MKLKISVLGIFLGTAIMSGIGCRKELPVKQSQIVQKGSFATTSGIFSHTQLKAFDYPSGSSNRLFVGVAVGDFDGSGIATIALLKRENSQVIFMRSGNDGSHYQIPFSFNVGTSDNFKGITAGDMDGDGRDELIILRNGSASVSNILVYKMPINFSGTATLAAQITIGGGSYDFRGIAAGDFDGDGKAEVAIAKTASSQFIFYSLSGSSLILEGFINRTNDVAENKWGAVAAGDLDGDGKAEFIAVREGSGSIDDILVYKISSTWSITSAGSFNHGGGTAHYAWKGAAAGEFDQDRSNGKEFVLYKNASSYFIYYKYNGTSSAPTTLGGANYGSETAYPWTGIAAGATLINTGGDQVVSVRQKAGGPTVAVYGDITTRSDSKKTAMSRNNFSFGTYYQNLNRNADGTLDIAGLKAFCETNKIYTFSVMIAERWVDPATGAFHVDGTEYKSFVELLELLKSSGSPIKIIALLVPPSESSVSSSYLPNPGDSPYIGAAELGSGITDERSLFSGGPASPNANDFAAWFKLLGILGKKYPNLAGVSIDDFNHNTVETGTSEAFNRVVLGKMMKNLRENDEDMAFVPVVYYTGTVLSSTNHWMREYTDGFTFYSRNESTKDPMLITPPDVTRTGTSWNMHGAVVLPSSDIAGGKNYINTEINSFYSWMANPTKLLLLGIYASTHSGSTTAPTAFTTDKMLGQAKANANCDGVIIYTTQTPTSPIGLAVYSRFNSWW